MRHSTPSRKAVPVGKGLAEPILLGPWDSSGIGAAFRTRKWNHGGVRVRQPPHGRRRGLQLEDQRLDLLQSSDAGLGGTAGFGQPLHPLDPLVSGKGLFLQVDAQLSGCFEVGQ